MDISSRTIGKILIISSILLFIIFAVIKINVDSQGSLLCEVVQSDPDLTMDDCPAHNDPSSWFIMIGFGLIFIMLFIGVKMFFDGNKTSLKKESFQIMDLSTLSSEERKIYDLLRSNNGSMYQGDILKSTNFSKVKVTRILDRMENKTILERRRRGMANLIVLK